MSSIIAEIEQAEALGEHSWRLPSGLVVREIVGIPVAEARQRLQDLQKYPCPGVVVPEHLIYEQKRLFSKRPWIEGRPLQPIIELEVAERLLEFFASLPQELVLYDLRPEHLIDTAQGLKLVEAGLSVKGTPPYASPEQYGRGQVTVAVGLYQLGATLLHLLSGVVPQDAMTLLIPNVEPPLISQLPSSLAERFRQLLESRPQDRPAAKALLEEYRAWQSFRTGMPSEDSPEGEYDVSSWSKGQDEEDLVGDTLVAAVRSKADQVSDSLRHRFNSWWDRSQLLLTMVGLPLVVASTVGVILWSLGDEMFPSEQAVNVSSAADDGIERPGGRVLPRSWVSRVDGARMVLIPAGPFYEGPTPEAGAGAEPMVTVLPAFYIDRFEVTNRQFAEFVKQTGYKAEGNWQKYATPDRMNHPVVCVSWHDAQAYAKWAGKRLPTDEEWEKAARGGDARRFPWGNKWDSRRLNCFDSNRGNTAPVGSYPNGASPYGVEDMAGNVWEWVDSWFIPASSDTSLAMQRSIRGGSRSDKAEDCLIVAKRGVFPENGGLVNSGFRCVIDPRLDAGADEDSSFVELHPLEPGTGYARSHLEPPEPPKPKVEEKAPVEVADYGDAPGDTYGADAYGDYGYGEGRYNAAFDNSADQGYSAASSQPLPPPGAYGAYGDASNYGSSQWQEGGYPADMGGAGADNGLTQQKEVKMNMSSSYTDPNDWQLTGNFEP